MRAGEICQVCLGVVSSGCRPLEVVERNGGLFEVFIETPEVVESNSPGWINV